MLLFFLCGVLMFDEMKVMHFFFCFILEAINEKGFCLLLTGVLLPSIRFLLSFVTGAIEWTPEEYSGGQFLRQHQSK